MFYIYSMKREQKQFEEKRQDTITRVKFNKALFELNVLLQCYDKKYHYNVIHNYLNVYHYNFNNTIKGRLLIKLNVI